MSLSEHLPYLFEDASLSAMRNFIDRKTMFAFDLDGTLAPISPDPNTIGIPDSIRKELSILNERAAVAVITGRSRCDAQMHLGVTPRYLIGNHGAEGLPGWEARENEFIRTAKEWLSQMNILLPINDRTGIVIENKGLTLSIHYRHAENIEVTHALILHVIDRLIPSPRRISGIFIENLVPSDAPDKGVAFRLLLHQADCPKGFFIGDDETDEDVFRLKDKGIFTVRVGSRTNSRARFYLNGQHEIVRLLREINSAVEQVKK
jgi:trehalose 6-phosphate phosphatase